MTAFIIRRLLWTIPVLLLVILLTFVLMRQIEGNPFRRTSRAVPPAVQANLERKFNLDEPWYVQYALYVKGVFTLDLGPSLVSRDRTVNDIVKEHFPKSLELGLLAFVWAIVLGIPMGVIAALRQNSAWDYSLMFVSNVGYAVPSFLIATLLIYYVSLKAGLLPTNGWDGWKYKILPSFALGLAPMAYFARLVRGSMLETLQQDYVRTAKAKGLRNRRIVVVHVLRNSLIPAVTAMAPLLGFIITGTFVIEVIFSIPGIGRYFITAISSRDYSVVMGITVLTSVVIVIANLIVDILYGILDPADQGRSYMTIDPREAYAGGTALPDIVPGAAAPGAGAPMQHASLWRDAWRRYLQNKGAVISGGIFVIFVLFCVIWPFISPYDIRNDPLNFSEAYETPSLQHPLGTDKLGKDMLTKLALGGRISIAIGIGATLTILFIGVVYGSIAGFAGGVLDNIQMRILDALYGLPYLPFAIIVLAIIGENNLWTMVIALSIASWFTAARIVRGQIITLKENDYVRAAKAVGARWYRILTRHLLPNTLGILIIAIFLELPGVILGEAFLSFIGLGISPPDSSLGSMAQEGREVYRVHPYIIAIPSIAIAMLVLCANFIADGMRDALDPRTRETKEH